MKRSIFITTLICGVILMGLNATTAQAFEVLTEEDFVQNIVVKEQLIKTADNAIILFDTSGSMNDPYLDTKMSRYDVAKKTLKERNAYFPDLGHNIGLYVYTPWTPIYPVQPYNREKIAKALEQMPGKATGPTMLQSGLRKLEGVLKELSGKTAVFIYTDGTYTDTAGKSPVSLVKELVDKYNVCFYVISTADDEASRAVLEKVGSVKSCVRVIPFKKFIGRPEHNIGALFVVRAKEEIETTTETKLAGVKVDNILFDFDKADIRPELSRELDVLAEFMQEHPTTYVVLAGYASSEGREEYNLGLSHKRTNIVADYLVSNYNISPDRIECLWFGQLNPVGDNSTTEGRRLNRRVEIAVGGL